MGHFVRNRRSFWNYAVTYYKIHFKVTSTGRSSIHDFTYNRISKVLNNFQKFGSDTANVRGWIVFREQDMSQGAFAGGERPQPSYSDGVFSQQGVKTGQFLTHTVLEKVEQNCHHSCFTGICEHKSTLWGPASQVSAGGVWLVNVFRVTCAIPSATCK